MSPTCLPILTSAVPQDKFFIPAAWSGSWTHHTVSASAVNPTPWRRLSPAFLFEQTFLIYRSLRHLSSHFHSPRAKRDSKRARESEVYLWTPKQASLLWDHGFSWMALVTPHACCLAPTVTSPRYSLPVWHSVVLGLPTWHSSISNVVLSTTSLFCLGLPCYLMTQNNPWKLWSPWMT